MKFRSKKCLTCGVEFLPKSGRALRCGPHAEEFVREQRRIWNAAHPERNARRDRTAEGERRKSKEELVQGEINGELLEVLVRRVAEIEARVDALQYDAPRLGKKLRGEAANRTRSFVATPAADGADEDDEGIGI